MYLKKTYRKESGRTYLVIAQKYRNPETKISSDRTVQSLGWLDELEKQYDDPIAHFKEIAKKMTDDEKTKKQNALLLSMNEQLSQSADNRKNYGYSAIMKIYHELLLHKFFTAKARYQKFGFSTNSIMLLLVISRALSPGSNKNAFDEKSRYFELFNFEFADIYRALPHFARISKQAQEFMHGQVSKKYDSDSSVVFFGTTNFYFEIDEADDLKRRGFSKRQKPAPLVQLGLSLDRDGVPINYILSPGKKHGSETLRDVIGEVCRNCNTDRVVVVGDIGGFTVDNIWYLIGNNPLKQRHGYIFSFSVRDEKKNFKKYVLAQDGYINIKGEPAGKNDEFKMKARHISRKIEITRIQDGGITANTIFEKQIIFWSRKYANKAKAEREVMIRKTMAYDLETIEEAEKLDGYYAIVTSELETPDEKIIEILKGFWEIEETFCIVKDNLETHPARVSIEDRIEAHFLTCFIALTIVRILHKITKGEFPAEKITGELNRISCSNIQDNLYLFDYRSKITDAIGAAAGIDFTNKFVRFGEIKKSLQNAKK